MLAKLAKSSSCPADPKKVGTAESGNKKWEQLKALPSKGFRILFPQFPLFSPKNGHPEKQYFKPGRQLLCRLAEGGLYHGLFIHHAVQEVGPRLQHGQPLGFVLGVAVGAGHAGYGMAQGGFYHLRWVTLFTQ